MAFSADVWNYVEQLRVDTEFRTQHQRTMTPTFKRIKRKGSYQSHLYRKVTKAEYDRTPCRSSGGGLIDLSLYGHSDWYLMGHDMSQGHLADYYILKDVHDHSHIYRDRQLCCVSRACQICYP